MARAPAALPQEFTPSSGDELQTEYFVPRHHASRPCARSPRCATARAGADDLRGVRTIAADARCG
ncbi:MAG: hypothetical protein U0Z44_13065 [Kouleothrix sp.]